MLRGILLAFVFGIWLLQQQASLPNVLWMLLLPLGGLLLAKNFIKKPLQLALALMAGFFWAALVAQHRLADSLPSFWQGKDIELVGVVADLPKRQQRGERFLFDVEQVLTPEARIPARISLIYYFAKYGEAIPTQHVQQFHPGERWHLTVRLKRPHTSYNPGGFDFEQWALERNIRATGNLRQSDSNQRVSHMVWQPSYVIERIREMVRNRFIRVLGEQPYQGVLRALAIGDESGISRDDWQVFLRTGVIHLVSISGLHVTMVSGLLFTLIYALWCRVPALALRLPARKAAVLAGAMTALAYALLAGFSVPTQRTFYMLSVVAIALWRGRSISISLVLCWALFVVAVIDPWAVLSAGFWLSFGAVAFILFVGSGRLARPHWLREAAMAQWAVSLGLIPLLLALFQQFSLVSPIANAFAIPLVSLLVVPLTLLGTIIPIDAILQLAHQIMAWCMNLLQWLSQLHDAVWQQHLPLMWTIPLALSGILWGLLPRGFPARWLGVIFCLPMFLLVPKKPQIGEMQVVVLDVGQGLAVLVQTAHHALLFDTGARYSANADSGNRIILPYLRGAGISQLDGLIVSHDDLDHSGGANAVLTMLPVHWFASSLPAEHGLILIAPRPRHCFAGQSWQWDDVKFEMLHPTRESHKLKKLKDNYRSCVLKITSRHGSLLLPGDIERDAERELLSRQTAILSSDVMVSPHHGSKTSSTQTFLNAVNPSVTIFTAGYRNRFGHPKPEVVARYQAIGSRIYRSDEDGAVILSYTDNGINVKTWRASNSRYWLAEKADAS